MSQQANASKWQRVQWRIEAGLWFMVMGLFRVLPIEQASAVGGWALRVVGPFTSAHKTALTNIKLVFPKLSTLEAKRLALATWDNLGRIGGEFPHLRELNPYQTDGRVEICGREHLTAIIKSGKPAVLVSGHFANWEVSAICANQLGIKLGIIYRATNNPLIDEMIIKKRAVASTPFQAPKGARGALALLDFLKRGLSIAILADQKLGEGMSVPFMGRDAMTPTSAARMALKYKMPIIPVTTERLKGARFRVTAHDTIHVDPSAETRGEIYRITKKINEALEQQINACPGQWLWLHRRWGKDLVAPPVAERNV